MAKNVEAVLSPAGNLPHAKPQVVPLKRWRRMIQTVFLAILGQWSFYGIFRCPFIVPYVSCQNCPVITCHGRLFTMFWGFWLLVPISALIFGRAFCGWACPGGLVTQLLSNLAPVKLRIRNMFTRVAPHLKYPALAFALYVWLLWGQPRENVPIRVGEFFSSIALTFEHANPEWLVRTFLVLGFVALSLLLANAWCRFICPAGGLLEVFRPISLFRIYKTEKCDDCNTCLKICEMGTRPSELNCTNCCDCRSVCPQGAIKIGHGGRKS